MRAKGKTGHLSPVVSDRVHTGRVVILIAAAVLTALAGCQLSRLWQTLPGVRLRRLNKDTYQQAWRDASQSMSSPAREGLVAAKVSDLFTVALHNSDVSAQYRDTLDRMLGQLRSTKLGRLQLAAFLLLDLERAHTPPEQWWPTLEPALTGLEQAHFPHFLPELIAQRAQVFATIGLAPASAWAEAEETIGHPHGPFLQYLVPRLEQLSAVRRAAGEPDAELGLRLARHLLRQWTLAPGPVGLRLLAADLLERSLGATTGGAVPHGLSQALRDWRAAYRRAAESRPTSIPLLSVRRGPELQPAAYRQLALSVARVVWLAAATLAAGLVACVGLLLARRGPFVASTQRRLWIAAGSVAALTVIAALLGPSSDWAATLADLRRWTGNDHAWPRQPLVAAGLTLVLLLACAGLPSAPAVRPTARLAIAGTTVWLALGVFLNAALVLADVRRSAYETVPDEPGTGTVVDEYDRMTGSSGARSLEALRAWEP